MREKPPYPTQTLFRTPWPAQVEEEARQIRQGARLFRASSYLFGGRQNPADENCTQIQTVHRDHGCRSLEGAARDAHGRVGGTAYLLSPSVPRGVSRKFRQVAIGGTAKAQNRRGTAARGTSSASLESRCKKSCTPASPMPSAELRCPDEPYPESRRRSSRSRRRCL